MKQIEIARTYLGEIEKPNNSGFHNPTMEAEMKALGEWQMGFAWCACFTQMVFRKTFPEQSERLRKLFTPSTRDTFNNFKNADFPISQKPVLGALVIWASYKGGKQQWSGHAGIVSEVIDNSTFKSIEGNTSASGSRNGDRVAEQTRTTAIKANGLNILGFITIL